MDSVLERLPRGSRIAILRLRSLGDCVLTTPATAILKQARPDLRLAIVVEDRFRAVFEDNPDLDEILTVSLGALRKWRSELCLNLHGGSRSAWLTALSGARYRAGFAHFRHQFLYNVRIPRAQEILGVERKVHTAEHLASAMFFLGVARCEIPRAKLRSTGIPACVRAGQITNTGKNACATAAVIHPVAATAEKTWHAAGFLSVAEHLEQSGIEPVFIGGPGDDLSPFAGYRTFSGAPLTEIKQLLSQASLFVGNDSGPAHMAAAFGLPVLVIFQASDSVTWAPWRTQSEVLQSPGTEQVLAAIARLRVAA